jgi:hypothetical protein
MARYKLSSALCIIVVRCCILRNFIIAQNINLNTPDSSSSSEDDEQMNEDENMIEDETHGGEVT